MTVPTFSTLAKAAGAISVIVAGFVGTYEVAGGDEDASATTFHDMKVVAPSEFTRLVDRNLPAVREIARRVDGPEAAS